MTETIRSWQSATLLCLALVVSTICAGQEAPPDFRSLFVEAEDAMQLKVLPAMPARGTGSRIYWVDNHRVIYTVRKLGDWQAKNDERSKVVIYNVDTGAIEETPYRGELTCYEPGTRKILVQDYPVFRVNTLQPGDKREDSWVYLTGTLGEPLTRFHRPKEHGMLAELSCHFYNSREHAFEEGATVSYLRPGDGIVVSKGYVSRLVDANGVTRWTTKDIATMCNHPGSSKNLLWLNRVFFLTGWGAPSPGCPGVNQFSYLASRDSIETIPLPQLFQEMSSRPTGAHGATYWMRPGLYVTVNFSRQFGLDGLYWQDQQSGLLKRISRTAYRLDHVSPDGCRNVVVGTTFKLLEFCKGDTQ